MGVIIYYYFSFLPLPFYLLSTMAIFFLAVWASFHGEVIFKKKDSPQIVIDEITGYLVALSLLPPTLFTIWGGFLFFRVFDIIKPIPINLIQQRLPGGWAVVMDDVMAGLYTNILLHALLYAFYRWNLLPSFLNKWIS